MEIQRMKTNLMERVTHLARAMGYWKQMEIRYYLVRLRNWQKQMVKCSLKD
jgi:hypothetical protein